MFAAWTVAWASLRCLVHCHGHLQHADQCDSASDCGRFVLGAARSEPQSEVNRAICFGLLFTAAGSVGAAAAAAAAAEDQTTAGQEHRLALRAKPEVNTAIQIAG